MKIKVVSGHLTATNKKHIKELLRLNLWEGKIGNLNYKLVTDKSPYTCFIKVMERGLIPCQGSPLRLSTYTSQFIIRY